MTEWSKAMKMELMKIGKLVDWLDHLKDEQMAATKEMNLAKWLEMTMVHMQVEQWVAEMECNQDGWQVYSMAALQEKREVVSRGLLKVETQVIQKVETKVEAQG